MKNPLIVCIILALCSCSHGEGKNVEFRIEADTLFSLKFSNAESCKTCLQIADEFPFDFTFDDSNSLYLLGFGANSVRKFDQQGKPIWERHNKKELYTAVHYLDGKLFQTNGKTLSVLDAATGDSINTVPLPKPKEPLFPGDNVFFYGDILFLKFRCITAGFANAQTVVLFSLQKLQQIEKMDCVDYGYKNSGNSSAFWPITDCPDCVSYLKGVRSDAMLGQSERFIILSFDEPNPDSTGENTRVVVFDKKEKKVHQTNLARYHCEPFNSKQYKFTDANTAVIQAAEYRGGMPFSTHYIRIQFKQ